MEGVESNSNLFLNLAKDVEDVGGTVKKILSAIKNDGKEISKKRMAEWITAVHSFHKTLSGELRGTLKHAYESEKAKAIELQKEAADLKLAISDSNLKIKTIGEELKTSEKKLSVSKNIIKYLKNQQSTQDSLKNQMLQGIQTNKSLLESKTKQIDSQTKKIHEFQEKLSLCAAEIPDRDNQITELNKKNKQYMSEISQLKSTHKAKEDNWTTAIVKLNMELEEKGLSVDDLNKKFDALTLEKNEVNGQLETLRAEKCSQENLIKELEIRLNALQAEHVEVLASFDKAQEVKNELTTKVVELENEMDMQNEVISDNANEKREAIRQLSSSLEHYKSRYEELRKAFLSKNMAAPRCFDFLHRPNPQWVNKV